MPETRSFALARAGTFDRAVFIAEFTKQFAGSPRYNAGATQDMLALLGMIERDEQITDVRWAAYMLATTMWETTSPQRVERPALNKKGKPLLDKKGRPVMVKSRRWLMSMAPVEEVGRGKGRQYHEPVKIKLLPDGRVRVTEHDGDQFIVNADGAIKPLGKGAKLGAPDGVAAASAYEKDDGTEHVYFGRGYVQLTWWSNYARAGVAIGRGFDLLVNPELVKQPDVAYALMSHGMVTGEIFANGHCFDDYFNDDGTNYERARRMVNGSDHASDIAAIARKFEQVLLDSQLGAQPAPVINLRLP